ncbi:hypothetical protein T492DRAFT_1140264 [Pavlovales sp. CCMP2436]|nr:hypothetical protein T492DRAFT_1140264 [Pavlovales sp. CCMP2436]
MHTLHKRIAPTPAHPCPALLRPRPVCALARDEHEHEHERWSACADIATCLALEPAQDAEMRVTLNLMFVGFQGDGNLGLNVSRATLGRWFEHFEATIPHLVVPSAAASARSGDEPGGSSRLRVGYRNRLRAYELGEGVTDVVHRLLEQQLRPEAVVGAHDGDEEGGYRRHARGGRARGAVVGGRLYQLDALAMEAVLSSLTERLELDRDGYTLYVLNPKRSATAFAHYGYRAGFSDDELAILAGDEALGRALPAANGADAASAPSLPPFAGAVARPALTRREALRRAGEALARARARARDGDGAEGGAGSERASTPLSWHDARDKSEDWARALLADDGSALAALVRADGGAEHAERAARPSALTVHARLAPKRLKTRWTINTAVSRCMFPASS